MWWWPSGQPEFPAGSACVPWRFHHAGPMQPDWLWSAWNSHWERAWSCPDRFWVLDLNISRSESEVMFLPICFALLPTAVTLERGVGRCPKSGLESTRRSVGDKRNKQKQTPRTSCDTTCWVRAIFILWCSFSTRTRTKAYYALRHIMLRQIYD